MELRQAEKWGHFWDIRDGMKSTERVVDVYKLVLSEKSDLG